MSIFRLALLAAFAALTVGLVGAVAARADTGGFTFTPDAPRTGDTVVFDAGSTCGTAVVPCGWDLNGDGFGNDPDEATGSRVMHFFRSPGPHVVRLLAPLIGVKEYEATVNVVDRPPVPAIFAPSKVLIGSPATFVSLARDPDNGIASESWDLNGDGVFGDARGRVVKATFSRSGRRAVGLRVADASGAVADARTTVLVAPAPTTPLNPFPIVRVRGQLLPGGIRIQRLSVLAPRSASIAARCQPSCGGDLRASGTGSVLRLRRFERDLRVGVILELRVTAPRRIGKFASFRIVGGTRGYVRKDACLAPGNDRPVSCGR